MQSSSNSASAYSASSLELLMMTPRTDAHRKAANPDEGSAPISQSQPDRRLKRQLSFAIDLGLAHVLTEITPRRYVEWRTTGSAEIGRALRRAILDEQFERRRKARAKTGL
ncbi:hypothetical protein BN2475_90108 [Paraburkholderia ribeironis]|uniref:Uncharacterized protein n=1 Tax=Paraburkholderia ribeironis TaxID=1247936 RepID=A0A1N7RNA0_9BURK|nr:hypothetical protein BN2475_90108 [Paraburkholderia ribeironis]